MPRFRVAVAAVALCALAPAVASANQGNPNYESVIDAVAPRTAGVKVTVINRDDRFLLTNRSGRTVLIRGYEADPEPYARIRGDGTVQVNTDSKAYYTNEERDGQVAVPAGIDPTGPPRWKTIDKAGRSEWHDHRMHWMASGRPAAVKDPEVRTKVFDYSVPIEVDGRPGADRGHPVLDAHARWRRAGGADSGIRRGRAPALRVRDRGPSPGRGPSARRSAGSGRSVVRRALALVVLAVAALTPAPEAAYAHASLLSTSPQRGEQLDSAPRQVRLRFSEPVEASFGAVRMFDARGETVPTRTQTSGRTVVASIPVGFPRGATQSPTAWSRPTPTRSRAASSSPSAPTVQRRGRRSTSCSPVRVRRGR